MLVCLLACFFVSSLARSFDRSFVCVPVGPSVCLLVDLLICSLARLFLRSLFRLSVRVTACLLACLLLACSLLACLLACSFVAFFDHCLVSVFVCLFVVCCCLEGFLCGIRYGARDKKPYL